MTAACFESPSLAASDGDAYEVKFLLSAHDADRVEAWARQRLTADPHGERGTYQTTTLYLDTPALDVYHKSPDHRRTKYRLRRYGAGEVAYLERKTRKGDRVRKQRETLPLADLPRLLDSDGSGWFGQCIRKHLLCPVCWIGYTRTAFLAATTDAGVRLTLDREVVGAPTLNWTVPRCVEGKRLLPGEAVLELKFQSALPTLFRDLLGMLPVQAPGGSKYGRCVEAWNLVRERL